MHLLKRVNLNAIVDHLALTHIIKSEADTITARMKTLLEVLHSYLIKFVLYKRKGYDT